MVLKQNMHRGLKCRYLLVPQAGLVGLGGGQHRGGGEGGLGAAGPEV